VSEVDSGYMIRALELARQAEQCGEVPVGALIVKNDKVIGEGFNAPITSNDPSAHAEIQAIRAACQQQGNYRLPNSVLYVTLEPCSMCAGAIVHARIERVVIAAHEPRAGAAGSVLNVLQHDDLNHSCELEFGLMEQQSAELLRRFFRARRENNG